ncbi:MAG: hydroxymethylpyrimidine/phosphomethylpyrimidine kinase [bacterium]
MKKILSVAGYDGSSAAGITSDVKIFSKLGIMGLSAITVLTAQNPDDVYKIIPVPEDFFDYELKAIFDYFKIDSVKIGLIGSERQSIILADYIIKYNITNVILDPVLISTSGIRLGNNIDINFLKPLLNTATAITPNISEAELISGHIIEDINSMKEAAITIKKKYNKIKNVIIKGSHLINMANTANDEITDLFLNDNNEFIIYKKKRINLDKQIHGTGCAFSAMIAALLTKGINCKRALDETEIFVGKIIENYKIVPDNSKNKKIYITANI